MGLEYYSFDKVLNELSMDEDELKRLVSEGQIRAFRDNNRMKFRKDDIDALRKAKSTPAVPPIGASTGGDNDLQVVDAETEETLLDLDGLDLEGDFQTDESSVPSLDLDAELGEETLTEDLVFDQEDDLALGEDATQRIDADAALDDDFGMQTEPLSLEEDDLEDDIEETELDDPDATFVGGDDDLDLEDEDEPKAVRAPSKAKTKRGAAPAARRATATAPAADAKPDATAAAPAAKPIGALWVVALSFIVVFYLLGAMTLFDFSRGATSPVSENTGDMASQNLFNKTPLHHPQYTPAEPIGMPDYLRQAGGN